MSAPLRPRDTRVRRTIATIRQPWRSAACSNSCRWFSTLWPSVLTRRYEARLSSLASSPWCYSHRSVMRRSHKPAERLQAALAADGSVTGNSLCRWAARAGRRDVFHADRPIADRRSRNDGCSGAQPTQPKKNAKFTFFSAAGVGAGAGFISGLTGVGGGVF